MAEAEGVGAPRGGDSPDVPHAAIELASSAQVHEGPKRMG
jgi:hypothetical protein